LTSHLALVLYEYAITFTDEIRTVWKRQPMTVTSFLFVFTRWTMVLTAIYRILPATEKVGVFWYDNQLAMHVDTEFLKVFTSLRVYALLNKNYFWPLVVLMLGLVPIGTNMVSIYFSHSRADYNYPGAF
ncbi:hypothetical protein PHLGIDRAFT_62551, partial [Phlebiopsis gigantea 11061_1 CR5-6]